MSPLSFVIAVGLITSQVSGQQPSPDDEVCQSILEVTSSSSTEPDCQPLGDCTGLSCYSSTYDQTVKVIMHKCTEPLMATVIGYFGTSENNLLFVAEVMEPGQVEGSEYIVDAFARDDVSAMISISHNGMPAVPTTVIPLNASVCACEAAHLISSSVESSPSTAQVTCEVNAGCTGQECHYIGLGDVTFYMETEFLPCNTPPGLEMIIRNSEEVVLEQYYFDSSREVTILSTFPLNVMVEHFQYSMKLSGTLQHNTEMLHVIPHTQVMIDKNGCLENPTTAPPTGTATPPTSVVPTSSDETVNPEACNTLQLIKNETNLGDLAVCTVASNCDALNCSILFEFMTILRPLLCADTPGVHVTISDNHNQIFNEVITEGAKHISVNMGTADLIITVKQREENISMKIDFDLGFDSFPVISEVDIPIDKCYCPDYNGAECNNNRGSSVNVAAAVSVPIAVVIVLTSVIVVVAIVTIMLHRRRRGVVVKSRNAHDFDEDKMGILNNDEVAFNY